MEGGLVKCSTIADFPPPLSSPFFYQSISSQRGSRLKLLAFKSLSEERKESLRLRLDPFKGSLPLPFSELLLFFQNAIVLFSILNEKHPLSPIFSHENSIFFLAILSL